MKRKNIISWFLQIVAALILLQTLYFKFSGHPESVELFSKLHAEPWGRIGTGILELITSLLLLMPRFRTLGALMAAGTMAGAIASHLLVIGIESKGDGGQLFGLAVFVFACATTILVLNRTELSAWFKKLIPQKKI
ncbi:MAG: DoxX family protein [Bacteroidetes bacterium]|nr:DoxX family protein [Bacteroidota bacterium]